MRVDFVDYDLPKERIAQAPPSERDGGRLLVVDARGPDDVRLQDALVRDLPSLLPPDSLLVANDTRVIPARLFATKPVTGGKVEFLLVAAQSPAQKIDETSEKQVWRALGKASKSLRAGSRLAVDDRLSVLILGRAEDDSQLLLELTASPSIEAALAACGVMPRPPYIKRAAGSDDQDRYQTVFAEHAGAIAAPTAGLHLSPAMLHALAARGIGFSTITLHVGLGTFQPVTCDDFDDHPMHEERVSVSQATIDAMAKTRSQNRSIVAVGTTVVRALESACRAGAAMIAPFEGPTKLLLQPGDSLQAADMLLTNFHLPKSTLLALVAAWIGVPNLHRAYAHAIAQKYMFYSYGDAMLITQKLAREQVRDSVSIWQKAHAP
jgi:S-adenosylmethionine:tRNA ribosyltransferase-isomerase